MPLIKCEIELDLKWTRNCVLIEEDDITSISFIITKPKLYISVVTLLIIDNIKYSERSEIATQPKSNNLDYLIDPTFRNMNRLFVLSFKNDENDPTMKSFYKYYMPLVKI